MLLADFIFVNYHSQDYLEESVSTLVHLLSKTAYSARIIIVDNSYCENHDESSRLMESLMRIAIPSVEIAYLPSDSNLGFGRACCKAAKFAASNTLVFVNCDTLFSNTQPHALCDLIRRVSPNQPISGPRILDSYGFIASSCFSYSPVSILLKPLRHLRKIGRITQWIPKIAFIKRCIDTINYSDLPEDRPSKVDWISGCFMIVNLDFFTSVKGFDHGFFMYFEDVDICRKAADLGLPVLYDPTVSVVHHAQHASSKRRGIVRSILLNRAARHHIRSWLLYIFKWHRDFLPFL